MSVDWSQAPEGTGFHVTHQPTDLFPAAFIGVRHDPLSNRIDLYEVFDVVAPNFGLPPGTITPRPTPAEAELRAELARLKDHDLVVRQRMAMQQQRDKLRLDVQRLQAEVESLRKDHANVCAMSKDITESKDLKIETLLTAVSELRRAVTDCVVALQWRPVSECELPDREPVLVKYPGQTPMMFGAAWARQYHPLAYFCAIPELKECEHPERDRHLAKESPE